MEQLKLRLTKKQIYLFLGICLLFGLLIRILTAYSNHLGFDMGYYKAWSSAAVEDGLFHIYGAVEGNLEVDYPPVFLFFVYLIGFLRQIPAAINFSNFDLLMLRIFQTLADVVLIWAVYFVLRKQNKIIALLLAFIWAINPVAIFNSSYWGQTDAFMLLLLLLSFYFLEEKRPVYATVFYALAGLTKLQSLYFAPVFLLFLFTQFEIKKALKSFGTGILSGILIFLPFMANSGLDLPFRVYLGGFGKYNYIVLNAMNIYGAVGLNGDVDNHYLDITPVYEILGWVMLIASIALVIYIFFTAKNKCPYLLSYLTMNSIFMLTTKMHERYQISVLIFLLIAAVKYKSGKLFGLFSLQTIMVFLNHFIVYELFTNANNTFFANRGALIFQLGSIVNLVLFIIGFVIAIGYLYGDQKHEALNEKEKERTDDICQTA